MSNNKPLENNNIQAVRRKPFLAEIVEHIPQRTFTWASSVYEIMRIPFQDVEGRFKLLYTLLTYHKYQTYILKDDTTEAIVNPHHIMNLLNEFSTYQINPLIRKKNFERLTSYLSREFVEFMDSQRDYTHISAVYRGERSVMELFSENKDLNGPYSLVGKSWKIYQWVGMKSMMSLSASDLYDIFESFKPKDDEWKELIKLMTKDKIKHMAFSMQERAFLVGAIKYFFYSSKWYVYYILYVFSGKDPSKIEIDYVEDSYKNLVLEAYDKYLTDNGLKHIYEANKVEKKRGNEERYNNAIKILQEDNTKSGKEEIITHTTKVIEIATPDELIWVTKPSVVKRKGRPKKTIDSIEY